MTEGSPSPGFLRRPRRVWNPLRAKSRRDHALKGWRAAVDVGADQPAVFDFLADLRNHWDLTGRSVRLVGLDGPRGGTVVLRGPLGLRRAARTSVTRADPPRSICGKAEIGSRTRAVVGWTVIPKGRGRSRVVLEAFVERCALLDRLLLMFGGHFWMHRLLEQTVARMAEVLETSKPAATLTSSSARPS